MPPSKNHVGFVRANERSWAIDVIGYVNRRVSAASGAIKKAGGEYSTSDEKGSLFPDVLLFGILNHGTVLQGWELKFPDTAVSDPKLLENAARKARGLGTSSFLVWNVNEAVLYSLSGTGSLGFSPLKSWSIGAPVSRASVECNAERWQKMLSEIIRDLEYFFSTGGIASSSVIRIVEEGTLFESVAYHRKNVRDHVANEAAKNSELNAEIDFWWHSASEEHPDKEEKFNAFAGVLLLEWFNKILFCHVLKSFHSDARLVESIDGNCDPLSADRVFVEISEKCDFLNILKPSVAFVPLPDAAWNSLVEVNRFLSSFPFEKMNADVLHKILECTVNASKRKAAGQYSTPEKLAELLVKSAMVKREWVFLDPCCGTGTIPRAVYREKRSRGIGAKDALAQTWAGDRFSFPVSLATMGVTFPENMGETVRVFRSDVADIVPGKSIVLKNPQTGEPETFQFPLFDIVVSNFPFIRTEQAKKMNQPIILSAEKTLAENGEPEGLDGRSDLYAYMPFHLWKCLEEGGTLAFISSNSWLGAEWGERYYELLGRFFKIKKVIASGNGRWFDNAKVVTTALILERRNPPSSEKVRIPEEETVFILLEKNLKECSSDDISLLSSAIIKGVSFDKLCTARTLTGAEMRMLVRSGVGRNLFFFNTAPFLKLKKSRRTDARKRSVLLPAGAFFDFFRGERRGWNPLFYPPRDSRIDPEYLDKVLIRSKTIKGFIAKPDALGFFCGKSKEELDRRKHFDTLSYINSFSGCVNKTGKPLCKVLSRPGCFWYEMKKGAKPDMVVLVNYDKRLFFPLTPDVPFIDQRFIGMSLKQSAVKRDVSAALSHALLNSVFGLFYIEALGFGRGLGALDLSKDRIEKGLFMLNPLIPSLPERKKLVDAFLPLLSREVLPLENELESQDRKEFEKYLATVYQIPDELVDELAKSLVSMQRARLSVL